MYTLLWDNSCVLVRKGQNLKIGNFSTFFSRRLLKNHAMLIQCFYSFSFTDYNVHSTELMLQIFSYQKNISTCITSYLHSTHCIIQLVSYCLYEGYDMIHLQQLQQRLSVWLKKIWFLDNYCKVRRETGD